jgi:glyoxylase-like metal-dependent hydrolase (beta-lactamase superfamily II)
MTLFPARRFRRQSSFVLLSAALVLGGHGASAQPKPAGAEAQPPDPKTDFDIAQITSNSWLGRFGRSNCAWIDMGDGVLVIDTGGSPTDGANLSSQIRLTTKGKSVKWIVLTHLHSDSNSGLKSFLPAGATVFVNARLADSVARSLASNEGLGAKSPAVVGIGSDGVIASGGHRIELLAAETSAHTDGDLVAFSPESGVVFVGDLLTPARCPMTSDPSCDPSGWLTMLDRIEARHPSTIIGSRGDGSPKVAVELNVTRAYLKRILDLLVGFKKKDYPEARVASELSLQKIPDYCPPQLDNINVLALYRRMKPDGSIVPAPRVAPPAK